MCTLLPPCPPNRYILFCFITCSSFVVYLEDRKNLSIADTNSGWETAISSLGMDVEQFFFCRSHTKPKLQCVLSAYVHICVQSNTQSNECSDSRTRQQDLLCPFCSV